MKEYIVELDIIGFVNPVGIIVNVEDDHITSEQEIIDVAFEHLAQTDSGDASFEKITENKGESMRKG